jgi:hypothetical protein
MFKLILLLFSLWIGSVACQEQPLAVPKSTEDIIMDQELVWAEHTIEGYRRKTGNLPMRSSIRGALHSKEWRQESIKEIKSNANKNVSGNLRAGRKALLG